MIKLDITGRNFEVDPKVEDYVTDKLGGLEKYLPRQVRETALATIILFDDPSGREDNRFVCEAILTVAGAKMYCSEGTLNMYAAIDIVAAKLKAQITSYKEKHTTEPRRARMLSRLMGRTSETDPATPAVETE